MIQTPELYREGLFIVKESVTVALKELVKESIIRTRRKVIMIHLEKAKIDLSLST
jgi:hypothetical protein